VQLACLRINNYRKVHLLNDFGQEMENLIVTQRLDGKLSQIKNMEIMHWGN